MPTKTIREIVTDSGGNTTIEFSDDSLQQYNVKDVVTSVTNPVTGGIKKLIVGGKAKIGDLQNADKSGVSTLKPFGLLVGHATSGGDTRMVIFASKHPFLGIEIGYEHVGGYGAATGVLASVAATDDPGPLNYALGNVAELKKMITPKRGGVEYNTNSANGWQVATWSGAASASVADAGVNNTAIAWTDVVPCRSLQAADGLYYGIVRVYEAAGPRTYGAYPGISVGTQYQDDAGFAKIGVTLKGGDCVTSPGNWTAANTITITDTVAASVVIRLHGISAQRPATIMAVGDSRFDSVAEAPYVTTKGYDSFSFKLARILTDSGKPTHLIRCCQGGLASANYLQRGLELLKKCTPDVALYLAYSINDGAPTDALVDAAKLRAQQFVRRCAQIGVEPFIVSSFPRGGMTAGENTLLRSLDQWLFDAGLLGFSPISVYGNADGTWASGVSSDGTNHMTQASSLDMATRVGAILSATLDF